MIVDELWKYGKNKCGRLNYNMENKKYQIIYADPPWSYRDKRDQ